MKFFGIHYAVGLVIMAVLPGCFGTKTQKHSGVVVLNVLDKELYDDCHIKGSLHMPFDQVDTFADTIDKDAQVVIYCSNYQCSTSGYAAQKLKEHGFENVSVYEGGMAEWFQKGLPVEGPCKSAYLSRPLKVVSHEEPQEIPVLSAEDLAQKMEISLPEK